MDAKTQAALDRVVKSLVGKDPANHTVVLGHDDVGRAIEGLRTPLADNKAGDVQTVIGLITDEQTHTEVTRALRKGVRGLPPNTPIRQQTQCLRELLAVVGVDCDAAIEATLRADP